MLLTATRSTTTITSDEAYILVAAAIVASILLVAVASLAEIAFVATTELSLPHMMLPPPHD